MKRLFTLLALFAAVSVSVLAQDDDAKYAADLLKKGTVAPAFKIPDTKGVPHSLADFKGSYVVLDFWATWCPDCRKDVPKMKELYAAYASSNIAFVGISLDTDADALNRFVADNGMEWLQLSELKKWKQGAETADAYQVKWIPSLYVIAPDGRVVLSTVMIDKVEQLLRQISAVSGIRDR